MADHPRMNPDTLYEWFVSETRDLSRNKGPSRIIKSSCTTEDLTIIEEFWLDEAGHNPALDDRSRQLGQSFGKEAPNPEYPFGKGKHFMAKVYPILPGNKNAHRDYVFNCDSFQTCSEDVRAREGNQKASETEGIRKSIEAMCHITPLRAGRLEWCRARGSEYLRILRELEKDKLV